MRNLVFLFMVLFFFVSCSDKEEDYSQKKEQELWLNGYTQLLEKGELNLKSGKTVKPIGDYTTFNKDKYTEVKLPVGKYFVVAFYYDRGYRRDYWNKYATTYFTLESRYNPQVLNVVIPGYMIGVVLSNGLIGLILL